MTYRLPQRYRRNLRPVPFDDHAPVTGTCEGWEWQPDVYPYAAQLAREIGSKVLVDVGCGAARKLLPLHPEFDLIGIDRLEIVAQIDGPGTWLDADFEHPVSLPWGALGEPVLWICSDVIEHLVHPERLVERLRERLDECDGSRLVLSTPDRIATRGAAHRGPSPNRGHVQEWSLDELTQWLGDLGLVVTNAEHTRSNDHEPDLATCLIEARA